MGKNWRRILASLTTLVVAGTSTAYVRRGGDMTLEQLTKASDAVVLGKCKEKKSHWVHGHIETDYEIEVSEKLKGGKQFSPGQSFRMTVMGGETTSPPISQYTEMQPHMFQGEEVALFLRTSPAGNDAARARAAKIGSNLLASPRAVGMAQGKFSVITDTRDGKRKLTRLSLDSYGFMPQDMVLQRVLKAVANREVGVTDGPVVNLGGGMTTTPEGAAMIDAALQGSPGATTATLTTAAKPTAPVAVSSSPAGTRSVLGAVHRGAPIPVQDLEEFKNQVRQFAN